MHDTSVDRRKFTRIDLDRKAEVEFVAEVFPDCRTKNISLTGLYTSGVLQQEVGEYCFVKLFQGEMAESLGLAASAKVVRKNGKGLGLMFTSMAYESYMLLQLVLLYESKYPIDVAQLLPDNSPFQVTDPW